MNSFAARLIGLALALVTRTARAGQCDESGAAFQVREIEAYAKNAKADRPFFNHICMETAREVPKLAKRAIAACDTIVHREPSADCVEWSAKLGAKQLGDIDLFAKISEALPLDPFCDRSPALPAYDALGDARVLPLVMAAWSAAAVDKRARQAKRRFTWTVWRHDAIRILGRLGSAEERAFLEAQLPSTNDRGITRALKKALAQIDARQHP
jgi:hypothetical protein